MKLTSDSFSADGPIPVRCAFAKQDQNEHIRLSENRSPQLTWSDIPAGTESLVLICTDPDVPSSMDDFNIEGRSISATLPRIDFIHWVMVDIPPTNSSLDEGACSDRITASGKASPNGPSGARQGINDYTGFFAEDPEMRGNYFGYDGPCPPWNDEIRHNYSFKLYATSQQRCPVNGDFTAADVLKAIDGYVLSTTELIGTYSLNPDIS